MYTTRYPYVTKIFSCLDNFITSILQFYITFTEYLHIDIHNLKTTCLYHFFSIYWRYYWESEYIIAWLKINKTIYYDIITLWSINRHSSLVEMYPFENCLDNFHGGILLPSPTTQQKKRPRYAKEDIINDLRLTSLFWNILYRSLWRWCVS